MGIAEGCFIFDSKMKQPSAKKYNRKTFSDKKAKEVNRIENQNKLMTSLEKHNGPCQIIAQLHIPLNICKNDNSKKRMDEKLN